MTFNPDLHPRQSTGEFTEKAQSVPESTLAGPALTDQIATYLREYDEQEAEYSASDGDDEAYEVWEDFRTDTAGSTYAMLTAARQEIAALHAQLAAAASSAPVIPDALRARIDEDHDGEDEPTLFLPATGSYGGYTDVLAVTPGSDPRLYTQGPDGTIRVG